MAIAVTCPSCSKAYSLKDEMAGQILMCAACGATIKVPGERAEMMPQADPVFERDKFLLRQKIAIDEKYAVWDEGGKAIAFIVRPAKLLQNLGAMLAGVVAGIVVWVAFGIIVGATMPNGDAANIAGVFVGVLGFAVLFVVAIALSAKRHTTFYRDESKTAALLEIIQDKKFQPITATYTVKTPSGEVLARFRKNYLYNIIRKRWYVDAPDGSVICVAMEDSVILSLLRRFLGTLYGLLRTNFVIMRGTSDVVVGEFNRKFTLLDRYVLDLTADKRRQLDRRIALALGVMLDTGERR